MDLVAHPRKEDTNKDTFDFEKVFLLALSQSASIRRENERGALRELLATQSALWTVYWRDDDTARDEWRHLILNTNLSKEF